MYWSMSDGVGGGERTGSNYGDDVAGRVQVVKFGAVSVRISDDPAGDVARSLAVRLRAAIRPPGLSVIGCQRGLDCTVDARGART